MAFISSTNRFNEFRDDFMRDTGIKNVDENIDIYIQYVTARFVDMNHKLLSNLSNEIQELQKVLRKV